MKRRLWAPEEIDLVMACYEFTPTRELAELLDRTVSSVYGLATKLDLHKSLECIREEARRAIQQPDHGARRHQFPKGHVPANKGVKRPGYAVGRMGETQFKKGQRSGMAKLHWMPVGSTRWIEGWLWRKVSDIPNVPYTANWKAEHYLRWERRRGPVPAGWVLAFKDGDRKNLRLANLELITRKELMARNTVHNLPEPLKELIRLNGSIKRTITWRVKHAKKQDVGPAQSSVRDARAA